MKNLIRFAFLLMLIASVGSALTVSAQQTTNQQVQAIAEKPGGSVTDTINAMNAVFDANIVVGKKVAPPVALTVNANGTVDMDQLKVVQAAIRIMREETLLKNWGPDNLIAIGSLRVLADAGKVAKGQKFQAVFNCGDNIICINADMSLSNEGGQEFLSLEQSFRSGQDPYAGVKLASAMMNRLVRGQHATMYDATNAQFAVITHFINDKSVDDKERSNREIAFKDLSKQLTGELSKLKADSTQARVAKK